MSIKTLKNGPQKLLIIGPNPFISQSSPDHSPQPRINFSYYEISGPDICSLICACSLLCVLLYCIQSDLVNSLLHLGSKIKQKQMHYYAIKIWYLIRILVVENVGMLQFHFHTFPFIFISNMFFVMLWNSRIFMKLDMEHFNFKYTGWSVFTRLLAS